MFEWKILYLVNNVRFDSKTREFYLLLHYLWMDQSSGLSYWVCHCAPVSCTAGIGGKIIRLRYRATIIVLHLVVDC